MAGWSGESRQMRWIFCGGLDTPDCPGDGNENSRQVCRIRRNHAPTADHWNQLWPGIRTAYAGTDPVVRQAVIQYSAGRLTMFAWFVRVSVTASLFAVSAAGLALELATEEDAPHNMEKNGKVVGIASEKLEMAFQRVGASQRIELMPWARAYQSALNLPGHCAFSAARTSEREALFKWIGPVAAMDW